MNCAIILDEKVDTYLVREKADYLEKAEANQVSATLKIPTKEQINK